MKFASHYDNLFIANAHIHELKMAPNVDLSFLEGHSVNDGIPKSPFSVQYVHVIVDSFIHCIKTRGRDTVMAKIDVAHAYRNVAIRGGQSCSSA